MPGSAQGHSSLLILCFPLSSSLENQPERSQGETRTDLSVQRNLSLSSENSPLSAARWPLLGCPSQEWKCLSRTTEGGVHRSCSQLQTSPHCLLPPQVYKNAGFPLPSKSWKWETAGSGTGRGFLSSPPHHHHGWEMLVGPILCNVLDLKNGVNF